MEKVRILIVEDERLVAQDIKLTLERMGYEALSPAATGKDALRSAAQNQPALVLMDIRLAGKMDGITAAKKIITKHDIPVIYLTAYADEETLARAKETSPYGYIIKPFDEHSLYLNIEIALNKHKANKKRRESDERSHLLVEHSNDGVILTDEHGNIIEWNAAQTQISGITRETALGQPLIQLMTQIAIPNKINKKRIKQIERLMRLLLKYGKHKWFEHEHNVNFKHKSGELRSGQVSVFPIPTARGVQLGAFTRDITERQKMEASLRRSEVRHRMLMEQNPAAVVVHKQGKLLYVNPACVKMVGAPDSATLLSKNILDFIHPEEKAFVRKTFEDDFQFDSSQPLEQRIRHMDGSWLTVVATGTQIEWEGESATQNVFLDITEQKRVQDTLAKTEKRYQNLVEKAIQGIISCNKQGNILESNQAAVKILGLPANGSVSDINALTYPPFSKFGISRQIALCLATGEHISYETNYAYPNGKMTYLRMHISPNQHEQGKVEAVQLLLEDFTEYQKAINALKVSRENFKTIYNQAGDSIFILRMDGKIIDANHTACEELGYTRKELAQISMSLISTLSPETKKEKIKALKSKQTYIFESVHERKDGSTFHAEVRSSLITYNGKDAIMNIVRNIDKQKKAEAAQEKHRAELQTLIEISRQVTEISGLEETIATILKNVIKHLKASAGSITITAPILPRAFIHEGLSNEIIQELKQTCPLHTKTPWHPCAMMQADKTVQATRKDSNFDYCPSLETSGYNIALSAPLIAHKELFGYLNIYRTEPTPFTDDEKQFLDTLLEQSVTAIKKAHLYEEIQYLATTDVLTKLYNRRHLYTLGKRELERAQRYQQHLSALMIDVDHFKKINDTYGHATGDKVLQELANHLQRQTRDVDIVGRYGGEEFVVILPNTHLEAAAELAERLRARIDKEITLSRLRNHPGLTISIGVASLGDDTPSLESLLDKADTALYQAKSKGRNTVVAI